MAIAISKTTVIEGMFLLYFFVTEKTELNLYRDDIITVESVAVTDRSLIKLADSV